MDETVRVLISGNGHASVNSIKNQMKAYITFMVEVVDQNLTVVSTCENIDYPASCVDPPYSELDVETEFIMDFNWANIGRIFMTASLHLGDTGSGEIEILEPVIRIDPTQMIDGVPAEDLYKIVLSEGILTPS
jgi:hypothetical protein